MGGDRQRTNRTILYVKHRYYLLEAVGSYFFEGRDFIMDEQTIEGRCCRFNSNIIGAEMGLPNAAVQGWWAERKQHS